MKMLYNYYFLKSLCLLISKVERTLSERYMSSTTSRMFSELETSSCTQQKAQQKKTAGILPAGEAEYRNIKWANI